MGANFSTIEIGKTRIKAWITERASITLYQGWQTKALREQYGYHKTSSRNADKFTAHCSDALALACEVGCKVSVEPGYFLSIDDTYLPVRRRLHDTQPGKGGMRKSYSTGTVSGLRKGLLIGARNGNIGQLNGKLPGGFYYNDSKRKRQRTTAIRWISTQFIIK